LRRLLFFLVLMLACSCARRGLPPGGPIDIEPPRVLFSKPDSAEIRVGASSEICLGFSESMDKRSVRDAVDIRPLIKIGSVSWRKNTFCVTPSDSLLPSTTYSVLLMSGCKDVHGNGLKTPKLFAFSTGDSVFSGTITGKVLTKGLPSPGIAVWAFDSLKTPAPDFSKDQPLYVSQSGSDGAFQLIGLPSGTYLVFGFKDQNANRVYDADVDFVSPASSHVIINVEEPVFSDLEISMVNPNEPGSVAGLVQHCFPDSVAIVVRAVSVRDSSISSSTVAKSDSTFTISKLSPGQYRVDCFADLNNNRLYDAASEQKCEEPHSVTVLPGETTKNVVLKIECSGTAAPSADTQEKDESQKK